METDHATPKVFITLGFDGLAFAIDHRNNLLVYNHIKRTSVNLGPLTQERAKELGEYLQQLSIHTPEA